MRRIKAFFKRVKFTNLFKKNRDGSLTPREELTILGIAGSFKPDDKIHDLALVDGSHIHEHAHDDVSIRKLGKTYMIMSFS